MASKDNPEPLILATRELLSKSKLLLRDIEELLDSDHRCRRRIRQECEASIEEDGGTLIIEGFRFECAASRDELRRLTSKTGV
ncbi:Hypothetical protein SMAX5B_011934 [Scophthalmus maximus]|nr:Hypothetical protein SMAX5B_011934 [Scophthalmus maximus]AWO96926.1 Hypothetical protein SMAX5B_011934 [Scophthalmus maximus]AWO96927.1 Hypothetical protein SMAX5B_011934 [Scophthalmus maximus]AWO96928.1 Hypothetical protein SMAX5B_011934 [Scophthalmus maximus]